MDETYDTLSDIYRDLYAPERALGRAHTVPAFLPYWSHIASQVQRLNTYDEYMASGEERAAHAVLSDAVRAYNEGVGGAAQGALMQAHANGELAHVPDTFPLLEEHLFGTHDLPLPTLESQSPGIDW